MVKKLALLLVLTLAPFSLSAQPLYFGKYTLEGQVYWIGPFDNAVACWNASKSLPSGANFFGCELR